MDDWIAFYDSAHSIYVSTRHKDVHYRDIAEQIAAFVPGAHARVLDYGCGEAVHADLVAAVASELILCDAASTVRASLAARFGGNRKIRVTSPEQLAQRGSGSIELIVANSVVQYLTAAELTGMLALWRRLLTPQGILIVADVIPPDVGLVSDTLALLRYALAHGFLLPAITGLVRTATSSYRKLRSRLRIARYGEAEFLTILAAAGFSAERLPRNMEHNPARMTFRARPVRAQPATVEQ
jgi:ubiquinone/menaquinone biosynthesis C-methylase UbiE